MAAFSGGFWPGRGTFFGLRLPLTDRNSGINQPPVLNYIQMTRIGEMQMCGRDGRLGLTAWLQITYAREEQIAGNRS